MEKENNSIEVINKYIEDFCKLELGVKCAVLTRLLSNLEAHIKSVNGNYDELLEEIIKISKGGT